MNKTQISNLTGTEAVGERGRGGGEGRMTREYLPEGIPHCVPSPGRARALGCERGKGVC